MKNDVTNTMPLDQRLSYAENFEIFRHFVSVRVNTEATQHDKLFRSHSDKLTEHDFKKELKSYFDASKVNVFFGNNSRQQQLLEHSLSSLYYLSYRASTTPEFASNIVKANGFRIVVKNEAKNLLSGTRSYSTEVAAAEVAKFREKNLSLAIEMSTLKQINAELGKRLSNMVNHIKTKLGLSDVDISRIQNGVELKQGINSIGKSNDPNMSI